jgi:phenylpropionate dioxygenase-like ring-hydroxylating dioxygenase large terminal subunit
MTFDLDSLVREDRVHGSVYTDPTIHEEEIDRIFHHGWVYVAHTSEVPAPGDYRLAKIGRQSVIVVRGDDGQVQILLNRCRHRANTVCQTERGNARFFRCAYHGWVYRRDGALAAVSYAERYDESFRRDENGLVPVPRVESYRGFMFASLNSTGQSLSDHLGLAKEQLDLFIDLSPEGEIEARAGVHKYSYHANWKLQIENAMDGYHPEFVHQAYFQRVQKRAGIVLDLFSGSSIGETRDLGGGHVMLDSRKYNAATGASMRAAMPTTPKGDAYREAMIARHGEKRAEEIITAGGTHMLVFPNLILIGVQIRVVQPVRVDETEVFLYPTTLKGVSQEMNVLRLRGHEAFYGPAGAGAPDDLEMFERTQSGLTGQVEPWINFARGLHLERRDADGSIVGQMTDELPQRGIYRQWKRAMGGEERRRQRA